MWTIIITQDCSYPAEFVIARTNDYDTIVKDWWKYHKLGYPISQPMFNQY